jgi:transposase
MKELKLNNGFLVDNDGIRYERKKPVATVEIKIEKRNSKIVPEYFEQEILNLQKEGKLEKGLEAVNAYLVTERKGIDKNKTIKRTWGPTTYHYEESCKIELYFLGA